ncbi:MAG: O-antigen ligase family protein, partial [Pyrinomonadaceae bacterium]
MTDISIEKTKLGTAVVVVLCATLIYSTLLYGGVDSGAITLFTLSTFLITLLWSACAWKQSQFELYATRLYWPMIGIIAVGLFQLLPVRNMDRLTEVLGTPAASALSFDPYATRLFLIRAFLYLVFFAAALTFINSDKRLRRVAWTVVIFGSVIAFFGILQWLAKPDAIYGLRPTPQAIPFGPFVNQHHFAALMEMTGGLTLGVLLGKGIKKDKRPLLMIALILMIIAIVLTGSRGGLLSFVGVALFVVLGTFAFESGGKISGTMPTRKTVSWLLPAVGIAAAILLIAICSVVFLGGEGSLLRGTGVQNSQIDVTSGRFGFWKIGVQIFLNHPIIGAGFDAFGSAFTRFDPSNGSFRVEQAHNDYLQMLADGGLAAFGCVGAFIYFLFR